MARPGRQEIEVAGRLLRPGSRVRLRPRPGGDLLNSALAERTAVIEGIDEDAAGATHVAVIVDTDPGRDLGVARHPAHRFFFSPSELEPLEEGAGEVAQLRVLVAGIGNVFLGDDGFGVAVAERLREHVIPGVTVGDYGIRGMDLAYELGRGYDAAILVDALPHGGAPGSVVVVEPELDDGENVAMFNAHRMDPVALLRFASRLGGVPKQVLIVGCQPGRVSEEWDLESAMKLSAPVAAAVDDAVGMVRELALHCASGEGMAGPSERR